MDCGWIQKLQSSIVVPPFVKLNVVIVVIRSGEVKCQFDAGEAQRVTVIARCIPSA